MAMHPYYIAEAVLSSLGSAIFVVLFLLQIRAEPNYTTDLGFLHKPFHRGGLLASLILLVWSWDFQGARGYYNWQTIMILADCFTCAVYFVLIKGNVCVIWVIGASWQPNSDFQAWLQENANWLCAIVTCLAWAIAIATDALAIKYNSTFFNGIFVLYVAISVTICLISVTVMFFQYYRIRREIEGNGSSFLQVVCVKETEKMRCAIVGFLVIGVWTYSAAFLHLSQPVAPYQIELTPDPSKIHVSYWPIAYFTGQVTILFTSWLPIFETCCPTYKELRFSSQEENSSVTQESRPVF
eukprot:TRINITY_DN7156_c0_g1_i1.p1 TRINITY_DN7156_c0_g1~~TRINITY_DN7156_c0_g1_i1.p1  ORF type:complete len:297 (-),score=51.38 TRINITY_DN7156_c0_g1_i1:717-1607(-)